MSNIFSILDISASGLTAQRKKLDAVAQNIANTETTRTEDGTPYKRRKVVFAADKKRATFIDTFKKSIKNLNRTNQKHINNGPATRSREGKVPFVAANEMVIEPKSFKIVHDPGHPDADENGNVKLPDINIIYEMVDMMTATRAYEANISVSRAAKDMAKNALDI